MVTKEVSVILLDIRNFTDNYSYFNSQNDKRFHIFIEEICSEGLKLAQNISRDDNIYFNSTGDGFIIIFSSELHYMECYLFALLFNYFFIGKSLKFETDTGTKISFGMGLESGIVDRLNITGKTSTNYTFLGDVINHVSRIESLTKIFADTTLIIGNRINHLLVKKLYDFDYDSISNTLTNDSVYNPDKIDLLNNTNKAMLLKYNSKFILKGINTPVPLFRLSSYLLKKRDDLFISLINLLSEKLNKKDFVIEYVSNFDRRESLTKKFFSS